MEEIGNERAAALYGGLEHRPRENASDSEWLLYLRDKYERRKWTVKDTLLKEPKQQHQQEREHDTSILGKTQKIPFKWGEAMDEFAQVSEYSKAVKPQKDLFGKCKKHDEAAPPDLLDDSPKLDKVTKSPPSPPVQKKVDFFAEFGL